MRIEGLSISARKFTEGAQHNLSWGITLRTPIRNGFERSLVLAKTGKFGARYLYLDHSTTLLGVDCHG